MDKQQPNSPNGIFVGRKSELEQFERALEPRSSFIRFFFGPNTKVTPKVFLPHGIGGMGKTRLSRECLDRANKAGWATIEIDWDRADTRPTDAIEMMNIVAEQLGRIYGEENTKVFINKQKQIKPVTENVQRLQQENQEKWLSIVDALQDIAVGVGGESRNELSSAVNGVGKLVNIGASALAHAEDVFTEWLVATGKMKPDERMLYKDKEKYLSRILVAAISDAISIQPLVILFDTCEVLPPSLEEWLRDVIVCPIFEKKKSIIIIVSGQHNQYRERIVDFGNGKISPLKGYADRLSNPPPISWDITRFADPEIADYIRYHGLESNQELIDFIQELARGVPFAVQLVTQALVNLGIEYVKENFPPKDSATFSTDEMVTLVTQKFLHHCLKEEIDLERVRGLAMLRNWDEGGLMAAWDLKESTRAKKTLHALEARYSFILPDRKLHTVVRDFVRQDLRTSDEATARNLGNKLTHYYLSVWDEINNSISSLAERVNEPRWQSATFDALNALYWYNENNANKFLAKRVIESITFDIQFASSLIDLTYEFRKPPQWCSTRSHRIVSILKQIVEGDNREELIGLDALTSESNALGLDAEHEAILFIWKSENSFRVKEYSNALQSAIIAKEKLTTSGNPSLREYLARNFNEIGWKLGMGKFHVIPSEDALQALINSVELEPNLGRHYIALGAMQYGLKKLNDATKSMLQGIELGEEKAWAYNWLGTVYKDLGQTNDAINAYKKAINLDPTSISSWNNLGIVYNDEGQYKEAAEAYKKALKLDPKYVFAWNNLGIVYSNEDLNEEAIKAYNQAIELDPKFSYAWNNIGNIYFNTHQYSEASKAYTKAIEYDSKFAAPWNNLGNIYKATKEAKKALEVYEKATDLAPLNDQYWYDLGYVSRNVGEKEKSIAAFNRAIDINQAEPSYWNGLGNACRDADLLDKAIECYQKAIELAPDEPIYKDNLANVYLGRNNYEEAIGIYMEMFQKDPKSFACVSLVICYRKMGGDKEAEEYLKIARSLLDSQFTYVQARIEAASNNIVEALEFLQKAFDTNTISKAWIQRDPVFDFIRDDPRFKEFIDE